MAIEEDSKDWLKTVFRHILLQPDDDALQDYDE